MMLRASLWALFATHVATIVQAQSCSHSNHCTACVADSDTSGWYTAACEYCPSSGLCSGSTWDSCSSDWVSSSNSCPAPPPPPKSFLSSTGNRYCTGGYWPQCDSCDQPDAWGSSHPGAVICSVPYDSCCHACPSGQTSSTSGSTAGHCVSIGASGTSWYTSGHRRMEVSRN